MQVARVDALPYPYQELGEIQGDSGSISVFDHTNQPNNNARSSTSGTTGRSKSRDSGAVLQRQWVTLTAEMWPDDNSIGTAPGWKTTNQLPILVAVFCGAALVVTILTACLLYWCCVMPRKDSKHFCIRKVDPTITPTATQVPQIIPPSHSSSMVLAEKKRSGWGYTNRLIANGPLEPNPWYTSQIIGGPQCTQCPGVCPVPRSSSIHGHNHSHSHSGPSRRPRPVSQPIPSNVAVNSDVLPKQDLPEISEFSPNSPQYASSSILDEVGSKDDQPIPDETSLKTRSLPAWVRSRPRPLSTGDDLNDLYAKVNFSKKRKNRMRNDEAAIIALSKSRSQFLHKDTDSLVDNEAVIVYDERTAL